VNRDEAKVFLNSAFVGGILALMFMKEMIPSIVFGIGKGIATLSMYIKRPQDLLVRASGFLVMSTGIETYSGSPWFKLFFVVFFAWIAATYVLAYIVRVKFATDFVERYLIGFAIVGAIPAFILTYPHSQSAIRYILYLLLSLAILYLAYITSSYISSIVRKDDRITPLPMPNIKPQEDVYTKDLKRLIENFVKKGDKTPLVVFILRNLPPRIENKHIIEAMKPLVEYQPPTFSLLTPPWITEKRLRKEQARRAKILRDVLNKLNL